MFAMSASRRSLISPPRGSNPMFTVKPTDFPYPLNCTMNGHPAAPYRCSSCGFAASEQEPDWNDPSLPILRFDPIDRESRYRLCPPEEGPDHAQLISPRKDSMRYRFTHSICGRGVSACVQTGVVARAPESAQVASSMSEEELFREVFLRFHVEKHGLTDNLDLEVVKSAPTFGEFQIGRAGESYLMQMTVRRNVTEWETRVRLLSREIQGNRPGFLGIDIARAADPRLGSGAFRPNQVLFVPFNLSLPLREQWEEILPPLDGIADYAYRFTSVKRPRRRENVYRDAYIFLSVKVAKRSIFFVGRDVFPSEQRQSREKKVHEVVRQMLAVVRRAKIHLPGHE